MHKLAILIAALALGLHSQPTTMPDPSAQFDALHRQQMSEAMEQGDYRLFGHSSRMNKLTDYELTHLINYYDVKYIARGGFITHPSETKALFETLNITLNTVREGALADLDCFEHYQPLQFFTDYTGPEEIMGIALHPTINVTLYYLRAVLNHVHKWIVNFDHLTREIDDLHAKHVAQAFAQRLKNGRFTQQQYDEAMNRTYPFFDRH